MPQVYLALSGFKRIVGLMLDLVEVKNHWQVRAEIWEGDEISFESPAVHRMALTSSLNCLCM